MQQTNRSRHRHITSFQVISLGFLSVILLGSLLLMLPIATKSGQCTSFLDASVYRNFCGLCDGTGC